MRTNFNDFEYIKNEISAINSKIVKEELYSFPIYISDNNKTINLKPMFSLRTSQIGFELDSLNIRNTLAWISPGLSIELYKPIINPISSFVLYGWSDFYKHSMYGISSYPNDYFKLNPDYYIGYSSKSLWNNEFLKNGIDFDENIYGLLIKGNFLDIKVGNYSPRFGPFLSSNLLFSGQYPAFSNTHLKFYLDKFDYHLLYGNLESTILIDATDKDSFFQPRSIYYHRIDFYFNENFRISFFESIVSGKNKIDLSYLNPLSFYWSSQHTKSDKDNLLMGFDWEYIIANSRIYGAFIMDEWAPTNTFGPNERTNDNTHNHNWFGYQIGVTKLITYSNVTSSIKLEYSALSPNLYSHDLVRNLPQHYNYNLGHWNGGNSESWNIYLNTILSNKVLIYTYYFKNSKGVSGYDIDNNIDPNLWIKTNCKLGIDYFIIPDKMGININYNIILSDVLYGPQLNGFEFSLKYNINY